MQQVEPQVYLVGETQLVSTDGSFADLPKYLEEIGAPDWASNAPTDGEKLSEFYGRQCYRSFKPHLNPNVTRVRKDNAKYLGHVVKVGHGSITEHAQLNFVFHNVSRVFCYSADSEVLTSEGWKRWPEVTGKELFATQIDGNLQFVSAREHFVKDYKGPMYQLSSEQVDLLVTPNHRMWTKLVDTQAGKRGEEKFKIRFAEDLLHKRVRYQKGGTTWTGESPRSILIPGVVRKCRREGTDTAVERSYDGLEIESKTFAKFLGFFISEGHLGKSDTSINITQNPGDTLDEIVELIEDDLRLSVTNVSSGIGVNRRLSTKYVALYDWLQANCGGRAHTKCVPAIVKSWSPALIQVFVDAMISGDGSAHKSNGHKVYYTSSRQLADDMQELALKLGVAANIRIDDRVGEPHVICAEAETTTRSPNYVVSFLKPSRLEPHVNHQRSGQKSRWLNDEGYNDKIVTYEGKVYCVKVGGSGPGLLYVRRNGKSVWSGNTHELVRHRVGVAISQESLRYVRLQDLSAWIPPCFEEDPVLKAKFIETFEYLEKVQLELADYFKLDEMKDFDKKKKLTSAMRRLAPIGLATSIGWSANIRTLRHVIEMRTDPAAEIEIRQVFDEVAQTASKRYPNFFGDYERVEVDGCGHWQTKNRKV